MNKFILIGAVSVFSSLGLQNLLAPSVEELHEAAHHIINGPMSVNNLSQEFVLEMLKRGLLTPEELETACHTNPILLKNCLSQKAILTGHTHRVDEISWSPDGTKLASGSWDGTVRIWDVAKSRQIILIDNTESIVGISWSSNGTQIAYGSQDGTVFILDGATGQQKNLLKGHTGSVFGISWSPINGTQLAYGSQDGKVHIWNSITDEKQNISTGHSYYIDGISWSPDGTKLASYSKGNTVHIWDIEKRQENILTSDTEGINGISWSPDGTQLASCSKDGTVRVWDIATGQQKNILKGHTGSVFGISWSPTNGTQLASCSQDGTVLIWDLKTDMEQNRLTPPRYCCHGISWSPDGSKLASFSNFGTVCIWEGKTGEQQIILEVQKCPVLGISWSPDGSKLASFSNFGTVCIWGTNSLKLVLSEYQAWLSNRFSAQEASDTAHLQARARSRSRLAPFARFARRFNTTLIATGFLEGEDSDNALKCCVCNVVYCTGNSELEFLLPWRCATNRELAPQAKLSHAICSDCFKGMKESGRSLRCPYCREELAA